MCSHVVKHYCFRRESVVRKSAYVDSPARHPGFVPIAFKSAEKSGDSSYGITPSDRLHTVHRAFCLIIRNAFIDRISHLSSRAQKARVQKWDNRMLPSLFFSVPILRCFPRDRRAAVKHVTPAAGCDSCHVAVMRMRRGSRVCAKTVWRRTTTGSNHISAYGVWRDRARRTSVRVNRTGETRWHRLPAVAMTANFLRERH